MMRIIKVLTAAFLIVSVSFTANAMADKKYYTIHEIQEQAGEMLNAAGLTGTICLNSINGFIVMKLAKQMNQELFRYEN